MVNFNLYLMAYFITDRPKRGAKLGLVVMDTPAHAPLASTFGRQLLDLGERPPSDTSLYARAMIELLAKSDPRTVSKLSDDVLNGGNDMQEFADMAKLNKLTTQWLRESHPDAVAAVEAAFADIVPTGDLDTRAKADIFHFICAQLYDDEGRSEKIAGAIADGIIDAVTELVETIESDSASLEEFILAHGITRSSTPAPKATGF